MKKESTNRNPRFWSKLGYGAVLVSLVLVIALSGVGGDVLAAPRFATSPTLGAAGSYSILGGTTVTNTGATTVQGDLGVSPGSSVTGFPPGSVVLPGTIHITDVNAALAQIASSAAFDYLDQPCTTDYGAVTKNLTSATVFDPGVYCADAFMLTGNLPLGPGVYIFKSASTVITSPGSSITGGDPCNVWWRVASSATLDTTTSFIGNIIALNSITLNTGVRLAGRALAKIAAVTMDSTTITGAACLTANVGQGTTEEEVPLLPETGSGAPILNESFPWSWLLVIAIGAVALFFVFRAFRKADHRSK